MHLRSGFRRATLNTEQYRVPMMGYCVSGLELKRFSETDFSLLPLPPVNRLHETECGVRLTKFRIKFDRLGDQRVQLGSFGIPQYQRVSQADVGKREGRVHGDRITEKALCILQAVLITF